MIDAYSELVSKVRAWFERADAAGWPDEADRRRFAALEQATPADLFAEGSPRPLVVALFGGTGVGKSSLLNRLAGGPIARVGVERPTSREVTLYAHESVRLADLPADLPLDRVQTRRHSLAAQRDVLWVDAPDIDSTAEANRRCAVAWLPHVDLLCYVVSPERYRDDAGWRVLRARGHRHGWMFVMNRWDEGDPRQREDFRGLLRPAGFPNPLLFCTCCADEARPLPTADEFDRIQVTIRELLAAHVLRELTRLGHAARLRELRDVLAAVRQRLGDDAQWERVAAALDERWQHARLQLLQGATWSLRTIAARFAVRASGTVRYLAQQVAGRWGGPARPANERPEAEAGDLRALTAALWDEWYQAKVEACVDAVELAAARSGLATRPVRTRLDGVGRTCGRLIVGHVDDSVRAALEQPGGILLRLGRRVSSALATALPLAVLAWIAYLLVVGYYRATIGQGTYLGTDFAVHSLLLLLAAWALPYWAGRMLTPSLETTALRAMRRGFGSGLDGLAEELRNAFADAADEGRRYQAEIQDLLGRATGIVGGAAAERHEALGRLIAVDEAGGYVVTSVG